MLPPRTLLGKQQINAMDREIEMVEEIKDRFYWQYPFPYDNSALVTGYFNGTPLKEVVKKIFPDLLVFEIEKLIEYALWDVEGQPWIQ